jgi:hypothetical protein
MDRKVNISVAARALYGNGKGRGGILWRREGKTQEVEEKTRHVITRVKEKFETMAPHCTMRKPVPLKLPVEWSLYYIDAIKCVRK